MPAWYLPGYYTQKQMQAFKGQVWVLMVRKMCRNNNTSFLSGQHNCPWKTIAHAIQSAWGSSLEWFFFCFNEKCKIQICIYYSGIGGRKQAGVPCSNPFHAVAGGKKGLVKAKNWQAPLKGLLVWILPLQVIVAIATSAVLMGPTLLYWFLSPAKQAGARDWCIHDAPATL